MLPKSPRCAACLGSSWYGGLGFMPHAEGTGVNGVMLVGEALGEEEAKRGLPFQGRAGGALTQMLQRRGYVREEFWIDNCLRCRPPNNKLVGQPYERPMLAFCPFLDESITELKPRAIVAMGAVAFHKLTGIGRELSYLDVRGYVFKSVNGPWVVPTYHPAFIMRGMHELTGVFLSDIGTALGIAANGFAYHEPTYLLDPTPQGAAQWADEFQRVHTSFPSGTRLAFDIETPYSRKRTKESELELDNPSFTILRISFSYKKGGALSIPWAPEHFATIRRLLETDCVKVLWNAAYDVPRVTANGFAPKGAIWDAMVAWHVLNSDVPKDLGFVTSICCPDMRAWQHLYATNPHYYSACDSDGACRDMVWIEGQLHANGLWEVFDRHILQYDKCLVEMSRVGIRLDLEAREQLSTDLLAVQASTNARLEGVVPDEAREVRVYKGTPRSTEGLEERVYPVQVPVCPSCGILKPPKPHFKVYVRRVNPCGGLTPIMETRSLPRWVKVEPWVPSKKRLLAYQLVMGHQPVFTTDKKTRERKETFDEEAIGQLSRRYPDDRLYANLLDYRKYQHLLATYVGQRGSDDGPGERRWVGGMPVGADGRVHCAYTHSPSTLRLACETPNLQQIPRASGDPLHKRVKDLFVASEGCVLWEIDYSAIEAVLVGYFAGSPQYVRLAKLGVHDFLNSHILARQGKIGKPADLSLGDSDLKALFSDLKSRFKVERDGTKQTIHASNYLGTPRTMLKHHPELFPTLKDAALLQALYFDVCPEIKRWQERTVEEAGRNAYLRNPYAYLHWFWRAQRWEKVDGGWVAGPGEDAEKACAFRPQSTGSGIIAEAILRMFEQGYGPYLRLQVHDSVVGECPESEWHTIVPAIAAIQAAPITALPLDPAWGLGEFLQIDVEVKIGHKWGSMREGKL